jgi:hypothetical protein
MVDIHEISTNKTSSEYYSECAKIFVYHDAKYYDEIITKLHVQAREQYKHTMIQNQQNQKTEEEEEQL